MQARLEYVGEEVNEAWGGLFEVLLYKPAGFLSAPPF